MKNPVSIRVTCLQIPFQHIRCDNGCCGVLCNLAMKYLFVVFGVEGFCVLVARVPSYSVVFNSLAVVANTEVCHATVHLYLTLC